MEAKKREDRRITRTRAALHLAMLELVKEKGYEAVTVEEITTRANLGRTTFYLHYKDKEELLLENLDQHLTALVDEITGRSLIQWFLESKGNLIKSIFETVKENSDVFSMITREQSNKVYDRFCSIIEKVVMKLINESPWAQSGIPRLTISIDYIIDYFSGAMWASIVWWAHNDFFQTSDEMAQNFRFLFFPGLLRALNVKKFADLLEALTV